MLKITAEEVNFIIYQFLHESGKSSTTFRVGVFWSGNGMIIVDFAGKTQPNSGAFLE